MTWYNDTAISQETGRWNLDCVEGLSWIQSLDLKKTFESISLKIRGLEEEDSHNELDELVIKIKAEPLDVKPIVI